MLRYSDKTCAYFWGCSQYPICDKTLSIDFNPGELTEFESKIYRVFDCFVNLNSFLMVTYGTIYFNLKQSVLLDYMLKSEIIRDDKSELEIGKTGARIYFDLYYHLMLIPVDLIRDYLKNNFPKNYQIFEEGKKPIIFRDVDYYKNSVNEQAFLPYKDAYLNY
jgi:hypothetical protein